MAALDGLLDREADAHEFAPAALRAQREPPSPLPRAVLYTVLALFGVLLVWAAAGRLDIVAVADGKLVPQSFLKVVQPSEAGIVQEILVREGDEVREGQVLMRMDTRLSDADRKVVQNEIAVRRLALRRIDAELAGAAMARRPGDPPELYAQVDAQQRARAQAYRDALETERSALARAQSELRSALEVEAKLRRTGPLYREQEEAWERLTKEGFAGRMYLLERQRQRIENEQDLQAQTHTISALRANIAQSEKRIAQITSNYRQQLQNDRVETEAALHKLEQDWDKAQHRHGLLELKAPASGVVKDLATHTRGTVVTPGTVLLTVVPRDEPLLAEVWVSNVDAGFVREGQPVRVKVATFPFQKYGMVDGRVRTLSPDSSDPQAARPGDSSVPRPGPASGPNYRALIELAATHLDVDGQKLPLSAGMVTSAEIVLGTRSVFEYLLSPIRKTLSEAGRER